MAGRLSEGRSWLCPAAEHRPQEAIDLVPHLLVRQAVAELELDQTDEERIERTPGGQELLCDIWERLGAGNHASECADLAARTLGVAGRSGPLADGVEGAHGRTKTAPVMPAAA